ncbi:CBS domain-containing protein [Dethiobacter alkaliphilus]|uniref:CBS domain containing membrane protein n=1 Tax=Dethiobacter alkaliphilus AHT 1 TaxID=555088 RepID=C0GJU5_DETAL|nr:CBS domain-containing protein [Dethiobacter alkaliphilus]EEG76403.1 CBS domain containing membrane protein [Dethiobacter alkaliphilus AHT 1]
MKAKEIMTTDLVTIAEDKTLREVIKLMVEQNISGIPVIDETGNLMGIVSESDVIRLKRKTHMPDYIQLLEAMLNEAQPEQFSADVIRSLNMPVKDFMTKKVVTVKEDTTLAEITRLMVEHNINRIPVVRKQKLLGIVTRRDAILAMAKLSPDT